VPTRRRAGGSLPRRICRAHLLLVLVCILLAGLTAAHTARRVAIRAGLLIDGKSDRPIAGALILIEGDKIVSVTAGASPPAGVDLIDLSHSTILPGLIDAHTHVLFSSMEYADQLLKQSNPVAGDSVCPQRADCSAERIYNFEGP
jgi:imidazolonepropionase-like amidohydrolase